MNELMKNKIDELREYRDLAQDILQELNFTEDTREQLNVISQLEKLLEIDNDPELAQLKEYKATKAVCKNLYIAVAKILIETLPSEGLFSTDPKHSFNLEDPIEQMLAAEYIKLLPNAFIGGPMKAGVKSPHPQVLKIIVDHYDNLPSEIKYTEVFPSNFSTLIRKIKRKLKL